MLESPSENEVPVTPPPRRYMRELLLNQLWQSANFVSKAAFLIVLTPLMLAKWGAEQYGLFALASSLLVSMALLDGGVRALTRIRMAEAIKRGDEVALRRAFGEGLVTFGFVAFLATLVAAGLAASGLLTEWFRLPPGGGLVLGVTVAMTGVLMTTFLGLEPLAARGNLSTLKAANTWGAIAAMPACGLAVWLGAPVLVAVILYSACAMIPNFIVAAKHGIYALFPWRDRSVFHPLVVLETLRSGIWYYLTTVSLIIKGHALTFVVSALAGPAEAGLFYILLRVTEIIGNVGATASETSLASLATARSDEERAKSFRQSWLYVSVFCLHGAVVLALLGEPLLRLWLPGDHQIVAGLGAAMAAFGLAGAVSRVAVNASMGLGIVRMAATGNLAEALLDVGLATVGYRLAGLPGLLVGGSLGLVAMLPVSNRVARLCGESFLAAYGRPLLLLVPGLSIAAVLQALAGRSSSPMVWLVAMGLSGIAAIWQLRRIHRHAI
jgi:O-antigen/teichoic acid export membrane protein